MFAWIVPLAVLATVPPARDQFPQEAPSHILLVVSAASGNIVRADDAEACESQYFPAGEAIRALAALTALEDAVFDPEETFDCDSTCWANGHHGSSTLADALAMSCDTYFLHLDTIVPRASLEEQAAAAGFDVKPETPPEMWGATARNWVELWSTLSGGAPGRRAGSASTFLAAGGLAVSSPRGSAHTLQHPTTRTRALTGASEEGAWVSGTFRANGRSWIFALFARGGTTPLATSRAAFLLHETLRIYRRSTHERGGAPPPPLDER
jgi:hypothetical protein